MNTTDRQPGQTGVKPTIVLVHGSHVIMISQPQAVTDHILKAARAAAHSHP